MIALPNGLIFQIAADAGVQVKGTGYKRACRCTFHEDRTASAFLSANNIFYCSRCTADGGWTAKRFCEALGLNWSGYIGGLSPTVSVTAPEPEQRFTPEESQTTWRIAYANARDDEALEDNREAFDFLNARGLSEAYEYGVFGVLRARMTLPAAVGAWPSRGYRLLAPLYDLNGNLVSLQARSVRGGDPKVLAPKGGRLSGTVFADERGLALLRGELPTASAVILGEGLTDFLALSIASPLPVLCTPGTSNAASAIGPWVRARDLWFALDMDDAGNEVGGRVLFEAFERKCRRVRRVVWPSKKVDACDVVEAMGTQGLHEFLVRHLDSGAVA